MAIASGASRGLAYGIQTAKGTLATTMKLLRTSQNGQDLKQTINRLPPAGFREDGQPMMGANGTKSVSITVPFYLSYGDYDDFLAAAIRQKPSAWPAAAPYTLNFGTDITYFTFEDRQTDIGVYTVYENCVLNTLKITGAQSESGAYVTGEATFIGTSRTVNTTELVAPTAAADTDPYTACGGNVSVGGAVDNAVTSFEFTIDNGMKAIYALGNCSAFDITKGPIKVTGSMSVYFEDETYINDVENQTDLALKFVASNAASNSDTFEFPFSRLTDSSRSGGMDSQVLQLPFEAAYDSTATTTVTISHS